MHRYRLLIALAACLIGVSAACADDLGYVDCSKHAEETQVFSKPRRSQDTVASLACGERFTVLMYGFIFSRIETKNGQVGYVFSNLISVDASGASAQKQTPAAPASGVQAAAQPAAAAVKTAEVAPAAATSQTTAANGQGSWTSEPTPATATAAKQAVQSPAATDASLRVAEPPAPKDSKPAAAETAAPATAPTAPAASADVAPAATPAGAETQPGTPAAASAEPSAPAAQPAQPEAAGAAPEPVKPAVRPTNVNESWEKPLPTATRRTPLMDLFGGYAYTRFNSGGTGTNLEGGMGSVGWNAKPWLQIVADTSYSVVTLSGTKNVLYGNHYGPRIFPRGRNPLGVTPFVEALFGGSRVDTKISGVGGYTVSDSSFSIKAGGGFDMRISRMFEVRVIDADYYRTSFGGVTQNNYWISAGIVLRLFGGASQ